MELRDRIRGGLYGQALGDAFCMPALLTPQQTRAQFGAPPYEFVAPPAHSDVHHGLPAGRVTDDTEQAVFIAREIIAEGCVTKAGVARAVVAWYDAIGGDTVAFVGPSTRRAVARIRAGGDLNATGLGGDTNGAAMRVSVIGLLHPNDVPAAARDAAASAIPTHNTRVGCASAAAVAGAVARALAPDADVRSVISAGVEAAEIGETFGSTWLGASVARRIELAVSLARDGHGSESNRLQAIFDLIGTSLAATEAVPAAFGVFALADGDPMRAARLAFELSGDADTVAAIACAIAGAYRGIEAIPAHLCETLRQVNPEMQFDTIADGLYALASR